MKRRVQFAEDSKDQEATQRRVKRNRFERDNDENEDNDEFELPGTSKADKKHTLDSDEEDNGNEYERLDMKKVSYFLNIFKKIFIKLRKRGMGFLVFFL